MNQLKHILLYRGLTLAARNHLYFSQFQIFIQENTIYYMTDPMDHQTIQVIEKDPGTGEIFNGIPDWVYEGRHLLPMWIFSSLFPFLLGKESVKF